MAKLLSGTRIYGTGTIDTQLLIQGTTASTSTTTGALVVTGGVGIGGNIAIGGALYAGGTTGTNGQILTSTGNGISWTTLSSSFNGGTITSPLIINNSTGASSTNTGALQVTNGGIGVGGSIFVGGVVTATTFIGNLTGTASTSTAAATAYALANTGSTYVGFANLAANATTATSAATAYALANTGSTYVGFANQAANATTATSAATAYALANTSTTYVGFANLAANATTATNAATAYKLIASHTAGTGLSGTTFDGSTAVTWTLNTATLMTTSVNLAGGLSGQIHYQSAANITAFISSGTTGQFLQATTNGAPAFTSTGSIYVGFANLAATATTATSAATAYALANTGSTYVGFANLAANATTATNAATAYSLANTGTTHVGTANQSVNATNVNGGTVTATIGQFSGITTVTNTTQATSTITGAFQVIGGVGIGGSLYVGGTTATIGQGSTQIVINNLSGNASINAPTGQFAFLTFNTQRVLIDGNGLTVANGSLFVNATTAASSTNTGALQVKGGVGIGGSLFVGGITTVTNTTSATSTITGALQVVGGVGIGGNVAIGGALYAGGTTGTNGQVLVSTGNGISWTTLSSSFTGGTITNPLIINNSTGVSSTNTGALQITNGGAGIGGGLFVGGTITATQITINGFPVSTGTSAGSSFNVQEFTATAGQTTFTVSAGYTVGQIQVFANGINLTSSEYTATNGSTVVLGNARVVGDIIRVMSLLTAVSGTANNVAGGTAGQLVYQSAPGATAFAGPGTSGQVLVSAGTGQPTYQSTLTLTADSTFNSVRIGRGTGSLLANTVLGYQALDTNTTGTDNIAIGYLSLNSNQTGSENVAVGYQTMYITSNAYASTAIGSSALQNVTSGQYNIGIGFNAGNSITTGNGNTIIGSVSGTAGLTDTVIIAAGTTERIRVDGSNLYINGTIFTGGGGGGITQGQVVAISMGMAMP